MTARGIGLVLSLCFSSFAFSQGYPAKPIRIVVAPAPGTAADGAGRIVAQKLSEAWRQPVIVENRPGAGGQAATAAVVKSEPDGYTLLVQSSAHAANPALYKSLPYDPLRDLVDIALLGKTPYVMVTAANGPYKSLKQLIEGAQVRHGQIPFASAGMGTATHLAAEYLVDLAGMRMRHAPFKGSPEALQDVLDGRSAFYMAPMDAGMSLLKARKLTALGVSTRARIEALPGVPSIAEQGLWPYDITLWVGLWGPAALPPPVLLKLNAQVNAILEQPGVKAQLLQLGIQPAPMPVHEFGQFVRSEMQVYRRIVRQANLPPQ
jgi:tripartite-type tricarboxylate transporter receptor subunit TctC